VPPTRVSLSTRSPSPVSPSAPQAAPAVTLSNPGNTCFQFSKLGITGDFSQSNTCAAAGVRISVSFTPTALGTRLGTLSVSGSDGITTATPSVSLSGAALTPPLVRGPGSATVKHCQVNQFQHRSESCGGSSNTVTLSCSGRPSHTTCGSRQRRRPRGPTGTQSVLRLSTNGKTPRGHCKVLIVGTSGSDSDSASVLVTVN
jgi:hypothetical protein